MRIYLAARYSRRLELCGYRDLLAALGHEVTSRWLNGEHQISDHGVPIGEQGEALVEGDAGGNSPEAAAMRARFAHEDFRDVLTSELLIAFAGHDETGLGHRLPRELVLLDGRRSVF